MEAHSELDAFNKAVDASRPTQREVPAQPEWRSQQIASVQPAQNDSATPPTTGPTGAAPTARTTAPAGPYPQTETQPVPRQADVVGDDAEYFSAPVVTNPPTQGLWRVVVALIAVAVVAVALVVFLR